LKRGLYLGKKKQKEGYIKGRREYFVAVVFERRLHEFKLSFNYGKLFNSNL